MVSLSGITTLVMGCGRGKALSRLGTAISGIPYCFGVVGLSTRFDTCKIFTASGGGFPLLRMALGTKELHLNG